MLFLLYLPTSVIIITITAEFLACMCVLSSPQRQESSFSMLWMLIKYLLKSGRREERKRGRENVEEEGQMGAEGTGEQELWAELSQLTSLAGIKLAGGWTRKTPAHHSEAYSQHHRSFSSRE